MVCPNNGFIKSLTTPSGAPVENPVSIKWGNTSESPTLETDGTISDAIMDGTSCTYKSVIYKLKSIKICTIIHTVLNTQKAELTLSFSLSSGDKNKTDITDILFCLPIYIGTSNNYLLQLVDKDKIPTYNYNPSRGEYTGGEYTEDTSLIDCVLKAASAESKIKGIKGYQWDGNKCKLFDSINNTSSNLYDIGTILSDKISITFSTKVTKLNEIFTSESLSYVTCANNTNYHILVLVFKDGLPVEEKVFNQLQLQMNLILPSYSFHGGIVSSLNSSITPAFYKPLQNAVTGITPQGQCPFSATKQYKCVPFDKLATMSSDCTNKDAELMTKIVDKFNLPTSTTPKIKLSTDDIRAILIVSACIPILFIAGFSFYKFQKDS